MIHSFIHTSYIPHINPVTFVSQSMINDVEEISKVLKILRRDGETRHHTNQDLKARSTQSQQSTINQPKITSTSLANPRRRTRQAKQVDSSNSTAQLYGIMMMTIPYSPPVFIVAGKAIIVTVFVIASLAFPEGCSGFTTLTRLSRSSSIKHNIGGILLNTKCHRTTASSSLLFAGTDDDDDDNEGEEEKDDTAGTQTQTVVQDLMLSSSGTEAHALEVFSKYASKGIYEGQKFITKFEHLFEILCCLDIEATEDDAEIVFKYLDEDGDGRLLFNNEFYPWYINAYDAAAEVAESFQSLLVGRRSIDEFDETQVDDDVVYRAIQCAIAAPNRDCTEPWRFICVGSQTVSKFAALNEKLTHADGEEGEFSTNYKLHGDWTKIAPGWCVVTAKLRSNDGDNSSSDSDIDLPSMVDQEDYKSVCCAIQNFMLSMWSEGIGTKWTSGPVQKTKEFADLCGADLKKERVVGIIWYGYATGGAKYADPRRRLLSVEDVLTTLP